MRVTHAALGLVLMLTARAAGPKRISFQLVGADFNLNSAFDFGHHVDGCKRSVPPRIGIERTDADEAMDASFTLQMAISEVSDNMKRSATNTRFVVAQFIDDLSLTTMPLGPARIHSEEHLR